MQQDNDVEILILSLLAHQKISCYPVSKPVLLCLYFSFRLEHVFEIENAIALFQLTSPFYSLPKAKQIIWFSTRRRWSVHGVKNVRVWRNSLSLWLSRGFYFHAGPFPCFTNLSKLPCNSFSCFVALIASALDEKILAVIICFPVFPVWSWGFAL